MDKHSVNYETMNKKLTAKKSYKFNDVKDHLIKVAFDVVKFKDSSDIDGLWQVQSSDDGEIIVALYEETPKLETKSSWSAVADKTASYVHVFYKNEPVIKLASKDFEVSSKEDSVFFVENLPKILAENVGIRSSLLNELSEEDRKSFTTKYPELG
jgi:hypothetical protein